MTDTTRCTAFHSKRRGIQMSDDALFISVKGGIRSVTIRIDEFPARPMRLPTDTEKSIRAVTMKGAEFAAVTRAKRLRVEVLTILAGVYFDDIDITGVGDALAHMKTTCPIATKPPTQDPAPAPKTTRCDAILGSRLAAAGLPPAKIADLCKP